MAHIEGQEEEDYIQLAAKIPKLFAKLMERIIRRIWKEKAEEKGFEEDLIKAYGERLSEAVIKGYGKDLIDVDFESKDYQLIHNLQKNVWQFSGAKTYTQLKELSEALYRPDGTLRSFSEFRVQSTIITGKHLRHLKTEYNTAVAGAMMSAKWETIQRQKGTYPLLQFIAIEDERTSAICNSLHKVIRPVDDIFWQRYYPPNHFNCRSTVKQLQEGDITPEDKIIYPELQEMFKVNLGERGLAFPEDHAYFEGLPEEVKKKANRELSNYYLRRAKVELKGKQIKVDGLERKVSFNNKGIKEAINQPFFPEEWYLEKNAAVQKMDQLLKSAQYLGISFFKSTDNIVGSHILQTQLNNKTVYLIVREMRKSGELRFYGISDNKNILTDIKE